MRSELRNPGLAQRLIWSACCATRCRQEAMKCDDLETVASLMRAANRYSQQVAELADDLAKEALR